MSRESTLPVSTEIGTRGRRRVGSIASKVRRIVLLCSALLVAICVIAFASMRAQSSAVDRLTLIIGPTRDSAANIFRHMTVAQAEIIQYRISRDSKNLVSFRVEQEQIEIELEQFNAQLMLWDQNPSDPVATRLANLEIIQRAAVERWLAYALSVEQAVLQGGTTVVSTEVSLFEGFRRVNTVLNELLRTRIEEARSRSRDASINGIVAVVIAALATSFVMLVFGSRLARAVSKPVSDLNDTINRQRDGDVDARAKENQGSLETMSMAREFNFLLDRQVSSLQAQAHALKMHELSVDAEFAVRGCPTIVQSLEVICRTLGEGLGVDRVMADTMDANLKQLLAVEWHQPNLPPLGHLPAELVPHLSNIASELWQSSEWLALDDRLAPEVQSERDRLFYRYTDARAVVIVPIGLGDQVIGMIYVVTVGESRHWTESEINAVRRVAEFLAHIVAEDSHRTQQREHIERLTLLDRQKINFVATVSHELRTPLTSIIGYLEVLRDGYAGELAGEQSKLIEVIDRNASRLLGLINNLLTLTQSESGGLRDDIVDVSVSDLIAESCQELPPIANSVGIKLDIDAGPKAAIVRGNKGQLKSVIVNIVSNAIKFSRPGGVVTIKCTLDEVAGRIRIVVKDRGIGVSAADQKELFTRFFRDSNAEAKFIPGTGLGLSIVKQIVNDHGGEVQLSSIEGEGTTVTVDLPLALTEVAHNPK